MVDLSLLLPVVVVLFLSAEPKESILIKGFSFVDCGGGIEDPERASGEMDEEEEIEEVEGEPGLLLLRE